MVEPPFHDRFDVLSPVIEKQKCFQNFLIRQGVRAFLPHFANQPAAVSGCGLVRWRGGPLNLSFICHRTKIKPEVNIQRPL